MSNCASFLFRFASQIVSRGAFSRKIYSHITPLGVFSGKICSHVTCPRRFRAEFVLKLSRMACFWAEFVLACSAWSVSMQNFFSHCVAGRVLSQGFALFPSFRLLAPLAFSFASLPKTTKLAKILILNKMAANFFVPHSIFRILGRQQFAVPLVRISDL